MASVRLEKCLVLLRISQVGSHCQLGAALPGMSAVAGMYNPDVFAVWYTLGASVVLQLSLYSTYYVMMIGCTLF